MRLLLSAPPTIDLDAAGLSRGLPARPDPTRQLVNAWGYQTLYEVPMAQQLQLRRSLLQLHLEDLEAHPSGCWQAGAFSMLADWMRWAWGHTPTAQWRSVLELAGECVRHYDEIVHVAAGPKPGYDGYRWLDAQNGVQQERLLRALYGDFGCDARVRFPNAG